MKQKSQRDRPSLFYVSPLDAKSFNCNLSTQLSDQGSHPTPKVSTKSIVTTSKIYKSIRADLELKTPSITINLGVTSPQASGSSHRGLTQAQWQGSTQKSPLSTNILRNGLITSSALRDERSQFDTQAQTVKHQTYGIAPTKKFSGSNSKDVQRILSAGSSPKKAFKTNHDSSLLNHQARSIFLADKGVYKQILDCDMASNRVHTDTNKLMSKYSDETDKLLPVSQSKMTTKKNISNRILQKSTSCSRIGSPLKSMPNKVPRELVIGPPASQISARTECQRILDSSRNHQGRELAISSSMTNLQLGSPKMIRRDTKKNAFKDNKGIKSSKAELKHSRSIKDFKSPSSITTKGLSSSIKNTNSKILKTKDRVKVPCLPFENLNLTNITLNEGKSVLSCRDVLASFKPIYFQPIDDTRLNEFIDNVKSSQRAPTQLDETTHTNKKSDRYNPIGPILGNPSTALQTQENSARHANEADGEENLFEDKSMKQHSAIVKSKLPERSVNFGSPAQRILDEGRKINSQTEIRAIKSARDRQERPKSKDFALDHRYNEFDESKRANSQMKRSIKPSEALLAEDNLSTMDSLSLSKMQSKSLSTKVRGEKLSPKGGKKRLSNDFKTYSKLDDLLKTLKDEKPNEPSERLTTKSTEEGLFAPNFSNQDVPFSGLMKSLAKILIAQNDSNC